MLKRVGVLVFAVLVVAGVAALTAAEPGKEAPAGLKGKTAYLNLSYVVKGYTKYLRFSTDAKTYVEKMEVKVKKLKGQYEALAKELTQGGDLPIEDRQAGEKRIREIQRQIEDLTVEGKTMIGRSSDEKMVELYKEIREVVAAYARQEGLDAVLHYNDATPGTPEFFAPANIARKMAAGATMPLYLAPGLDISEAILNELNDRDKKRDD